MIKLFTLILFSVSCFAGGPIVVGNGTGESEFNLVLAQSQLHFFWNLCQGDANCKAASDLSPQLADAFQTVESSHLTFEKTANTRPGRIEPATHSIIFNQNLLWTPEGKAFSLVDSMSLYLQMMQKDLGAGTPEFRLSFLNLVANHLRELNIAIDSHSNLTVTNIRNGSVVLMLEKDQVLSDIQTLNLQNQIKCSNGAPAEDLKVGNLSYAYRIEHGPESDFYFNSHIQFKCESQALKAHIIFGFKANTQELKMNLEKLVFQINSIEVDN